jgi:hypothetical protein
LAGQDRLTIKENHASLASIYISIYRGKYIIFVFLLLFHIIGDYHSGAYRNAYRKLKTEDSQMKNVPAITIEAGLAAKAVARLEAAAEAVHNGGKLGERGFQAVSSKDGFNAVIRHGKTLIEISGDDFAIRQVD